MADKPLISASDYNSIRSNIERTLGVGSGNSGYGQPLQSSPVQENFDITRQQWVDLRNDIINAKLHQLGYPPPVVEVPTVIQLGENQPNNNFELAAEEAYVSRLNVSPSRLVRNIRTQGQFNGVWNVQAQTTFSVTFQNSNQARYFFNTGGKILISSSRFGGTTNPQNGNWSGLLNAVGEVEFGSQTPTFMNFYRLTDEYQIVLQNAGSGAFAYVGNFFIIKAKSNVVDNTNGGATIIEFEVSWLDTYPEGIGYTPDLGDRVDGTLTLSVSEIKASGIRLPTGTFTVISPTYSQPVITAS